MNRKKRAAKRSTDSKLDEPGETLTNWQVETEQLNNHQAANRTESAALTSWQIATQIDQQTANRTWMNNEVALTSWQTETEEKKSADNKTNMGQHSHPDKQFQRESEIEWNEWKVALTAW